MKVLLMYDYPAGPGGLAMQGELLYRGLKELGVDVCPVHFDSPLEKEWYYRWFNPDITVGVGYWGYIPQLVLHPQTSGILPVPWLVADGYIANYQHVLNRLPLILVTSQWVKEMYIRDGIDGNRIEVLPVGCNTDLFVPYSCSNPKVQAVRSALGVTPEQLLILTVGGDACSKGAQEVMQALAQLAGTAPDWKYICKVWPQPRTYLQNDADLALAASLGIKEKVQYVTSIVSRNYMPFLMNACDIYAAPSRLEGFGMLQVEAGACGKPVIGIQAMGMLDTLVHGETGMLASVAETITVNEAVVEDGTEKGKLHRIMFDTPRVVDYRADVNDIRTFLLKLMTDPDHRKQLGSGARRRVLELFDYRRVAERFVQIVGERLCIS